MSSNRIRDQFNLFDDDRFVDSATAQTARDATQHPQDALHSLQPAHVGAGSHHATSDGHGSHGVSLDDLVRSNGAHLSNDVAVASQGYDYAGQGTAETYAQQSTIASTSAMSLAGGRPVVDMRADGNYNLEHVQGHTQADADGADPDGQLWYGGEGQTGSTSTGSSDDQVGHIDSDGLASGRWVSDVSTNAGNPGFQVVGLDTSAGLYFALDSGGLLRSGHITNDIETTQGSEVQELLVRYGLSNPGSADEANAFAVDPVNHIIYLEVFAQTDNTTAIYEITYNPLTGAMTSPYNAATGTITDSSHVLMSNTSTSGTLVDVTAMHYDMASHKLYYIDDDLGYSFNGGANQTWRSSRGIYSVDVTAANPQPTLLTVQSQFPVGGTASQPYLAGMAVDAEKGIIYFTTNNIVGGAHNTTVWWMPITGGTATAMSMPGGVSFGFTGYFANGSNAMTIDDLAQKIYVADSTDGSIIQLTLSADGHSFTSGIDHFMVLDANDTSFAYTGSLLFDNLPVLNSANHTLGATTTEAVQGGSAITLLNGSAITITDTDDNHLGFATVRITNAQTGDILSATTAGTSITASYNSTTHVLTLTGDDTYAHYIQVLNSVQYQDTGTDNSTGSHPTRTVTWTVSDGVTITNPTASDPNVASTTIVIDRAPTLTADNYAVVETATVTGTSGTAGTGVLGNDNDKDADTITVTAVQGSGANVGNSVAGTYGHLTLNSNGSYAYAADNGAQIAGAANGSHPVDTFTYTVSDGLGGVTTSTVSFTIDRVPTVVSDNPAGQALESGSAITGNVLTNDSDRDGDTLTVSAVQGLGGNVGNSIAGTYGHLTINSNGTYSYSADNTVAIDAAATGSHLTETFTYTANDGHGGTTSSSITVTIDRAPTVVADAPGTQAVESGSAVTGNALTNDSDRDGDTLTVSAVQGSGGNVGNSVATTYGHITVNSNGSYSYVADNTTAIDAAATGSHLTDTVSYTASDGHGGTTTTNIVITLDRAPTVVSDAPGTQALESGSAVTGNALTNDSDRDGDTLTVTAVQGSGGNVGNSIAGTYGHITINANGSYSYVADNTVAIDAAATGSHLTDTFTYTASDGHGGTSTSTVTVTLDRAPTAVADAPGAQAVESGSAVTGNVLTNDSDRDGDTLAVSAVAGSAGNVGSSLATTFGHVTVNADGSYSYVADNTTAIDAAATGSHLTDTVTYTASDGHGGTSTVNLVVTIDRGPTVVSDVPTADALESGASVAGNVLTNDSDRDGDTLVVSAVAGSAGNVGNSVATTYGHITLGSNGTYIYFADNTVAIDAAATGSHLTDTVTYTASDGHGGTTTTTLTITLDRAPTLVADNPSGQALESGAAITGNVLTNDSDRDGDTLTVSQVNGSNANVGSSVAGTYGHMTINTDGSYSYVADNTVAIDAAATGSHLTDTFTYRAADGHDGSTASSITVTIDRGPDVTADTGASQALEGSGFVAGNVLSNDSDRDGDTLTITAVAGSSGNVAVSTATTYGHVLIAANGGYSYSADNTVAIDAAATGSHLTDTVTYTVDDGFGGTATTSLTITLDRGPDATNDSNSAAESATVSKTALTGVLANDSDRDGDTLTVSAVGGSPSFVGTSFATTYGHITMNADGSYSYSADNTAAIDAAPTGSHPVDTITFTVDDGFGGTTTETLTITLDRLATGTNDALATNENATAVNGSGTNANLLANDSDKDGDSFAITAVNGSGGNVGTQITLASGALLTVNADGTYVYDPNHAFDYLPSAVTSGASNTTATDTFTYTITGGATLTVTVTITGVDSNDVLQGTVGNDTLHGGVGDDVIHSLAGVDTVFGDSGDDYIDMAGNLTASDKIDGGTNTDRVFLNGDYSGGVTFSATTMVNVEILNLAAGFDYNLTTNDATVGAGKTLTLQAGQLGAGDVAIFDGSAETDGSFNITTGAGNDVLTGGAQADRFFSGLGNDTIHGGGGDDVVSMGAAFTAADTVEGGSGNDTLVLNGNYSGGLTLGAATLTNVENIQLTAGFSYSLTTNNATVGSGQTLTVKADTLGAGDALTFNGAAENDGAFVINSGAGNDVLTGGNGDDTFRPGTGNDTVHAGGGLDTINMGAALTASDTIDGGAGLDTLFLSGDYSAGVTFGATTVTNVEMMFLTAGNDYKLVIDNATVAAGQSLTVQAGGLGALDDVYFDGSADTSGGVLNLYGGQGNDTLIGGWGEDTLKGDGGNDVFTGGLGSDSIFSGLGADVFVYNAVAESTSNSRDKIKDFDASTDSFKLTGVTVNAIDAFVNSGHLSIGTFDANLSAAIDGAHLAAHDATVFTPDSGTLHGHMFLVIDVNGIAGYQAGQDFVMDITGATNINSLTTSDFTS